MLIVYVMTAITGIIGALIAVDDLRDARVNHEDRKAQ